MGAGGKAHQGGEGGGHQVPAVQDAGGILQSGQGAGGLPRGQQHRVSPGQMVSTSQ